ncbi:unnamed protein product [Blepharisma stoltei]|uniref:3-hydroxyisobutyrate dehydrogenase n=1 Tax=Blepharisma stoltei TaxID=1481888 RepID=A0AAU9ILI7_9CILI|nr:unnamed protein product [Blepharisma stoltei]
MISGAQRCFSTVPNLLYVGLGEMGYRIAGTLSKTYPMTVWNRTNEKAVSHASEYGTTALAGPNPFAHDISHIDVILSCLPTSNEVKIFADHLIASQSQLKQGLLWLDNTSGVPHQSRQIAELLQQRSVQFLDVPISGGRKGATNATLTIMVGGPKPDYERILPILQKMGKNIAHIGDVGSAHAVKGLNNLLYGCNILLAMKVAQTLEKEGIDPDVALKAMMTSSGGSNSMLRVHEYVTHNRTIDYSFKANALVKDMDIGLSMVTPRSEDDPAIKMFTNIRDIYFKMATEKGWSTAEVFDTFPYIE